MANKNLLTYNSNVVQVELDYFAPISILPQSGLPTGTLYAFLSKVDPWSDDANPQQPTQDQQYIKSVFKNIFFVKKITSGDSSPVIERRDWSANTVYDYYQDDVDMFEVDDNGFQVLHFYVKNRYDQVFKCLWNANGALSTIEPFFQPGNYGTDNIFQGSDGYKWKYMITIASGDKVKFMDSTWIPIPVGSYTPNPVQANPGTGNVAGSGDIEVINVISQGTGYTSTNTTITITGDGTGATAQPKVVNGSIVDVEVTNPGANYTFYNITVNGSGSGAVLDSAVSPIGGHGFDCVSELGCRRIMYSVEFNGTENGLLPIDIDYRQIGLLVNPMSQQTAPGPANLSTYNTTTQLTVASGIGSYISDEVVYQGSTLDTATFSATVLSFDPASDVVQLINIVGTPTLNATLYGNTSKNARTLLGVSESDFIPFSGYLLYIENRSGVQRSFDGIEQFKYILAY
jgi:hypothetical protein